MRNMNPGAHRCVTSRVRKRPALARLKSVGLKLEAGKKSRTWSSAMMTMTMPRTRSTDWIRVRTRGAGAADGAAAG